MYHDPDEYYETIQSRYNEYRQEAQRRKEAGQGEYWPVIMYHTPAGEVVLVAHIMRNAESDTTDTIEIQGQDQSGNPCDVITSTGSAQIVIKLLAPPSEPQERKPVGFGPRS